MNDLEPMDPLEALRRKRLRRRGAGGTPWTEAVPNPGGPPEAQYSEGNRAEVRIVCDLRPKHSSRRPIEVITVFQHVGGGRWTTHLKSKRVQKARREDRGSIDPGLTLTGNDKYRVSEHGANPEAGTRAVYSLKCSRCGHFSVDLREPALFAILNACMRQQRNTLPLKELNAIVAHMAKA